MDTMQNHNQSSWGRIFLLLRLDYHSYRRNFFIGLGLIILFFNFLARMGLLFDGDFSSSWFSSFDVNSRFALISPVIMIVYTYYINRRTQHSKATAFSLLPANLWEKSVAMFIGIVLINLTAFLTTYLTVLIDWLLAPELISLRLKFSAFSLYFDNFRLATGVLSFSLIFLLTILIQLVQRKSYFKAFFIGSIYYFGIWVVSFRLIIYAIEDIIKDDAFGEKITSFISGHNESVDMLSYVLIILLIAIDILLGAYLYSRLKKLEV